MYRVLITGAAGFMGSRLVSALPPQYEVFALARRAPVTRTSAGVHWIEHDLMQPLEHACLPQPVDAVIHLAQSRHYRAFPVEARDIFEVNVHSTFRLLEYARQAGAERFVLASTGGLYGYSKTPFIETDPASADKFVESDPMGELSFYFSSKYFAELLAANYRQFLHTIILRFFFVYGPGQQGMLIPNLVQKVKNREPITIQGNPGLRINPIYIEDAVRVFEPALRVAADGVFNIAGDEVVTITELVHLVATLVGQEAMLTHTDAQPPGDLVGSNVRMKQILGLHPQVSLRVGLGTLI